jgi:hypothetical protein
MKALARLSGALLAVALGLGCGPGAAPPAAAPAAGAPAPGAPADAGWDQVVAAARKEGRLLMINHPSQRSLLEAMVPRFK